MNWELKMNQNIAFILLRAWTLDNMCNWPELLFCMAFYCNQMGITISMLSCVMGKGQKLYMYPIWLSETSTLCSDLNFSIADVPILFGCHMWYYVMCLYYFAWTQCASLILDGHNLPLLISMARMFLFFLLPYDSFKHRQHDSSRSGGNRMGERAPGPTLSLSGRANGQGQPSLFAGHCWPCHVVVACQTSKCGKTKTHDF